jgi:RNA polymerase sigma factor (sigma-70 family)
MEMIDYMHNMQCCHNEKENAIEVEKLLLSISEEERLIVSLRIYAEEEFASIAQKCGISIENAKKRFYRALEKLKNHLSRLDSSIRIK